MYFPLGWPGSLALLGKTAHICRICCDAVKIHHATIGRDFMGIWYAIFRISAEIWKQSVDHLET